MFYLSIIPSKKNQLFDNDFKTISHYENNDKKIFNFQNKINITNKKKISYKRINHLKDYIRIQEQII